ncbi:cytochrome P450 3A18-like [Oppia nitens]|uniref:cytochrome P450 3A18-like n=1 Tax=Oppia nitens TaxID=1686743 RepID=UPI0023DC9319|nr:cytochrome P450 3A18-like [Oppia nitens]
MLSDAELVKEVMIAKFNAFRNRRPLGGQYKKVLTEGLLNLRDDEWRQMRAILSPAFTTNRLRQWLPVLNQCCDDFLDRSLKPMADQSMDVPLNDVARDVALDMIMRTAFSKRVDGLYDTPKARFATTAYRVPQVNIVRQLLTAVAPSLAPKLFVVKQYLLALVGKVPDFYFAHVFTEIIQERMASQKQCTDLLQVLIDWRENTNTDNKLSDDSMSSSATTSRVSAPTGVVGRRLTFEEIYSQCFVFFFGNIVSQTSNIAFILYELAVNTKVQDRLRRETRKLIANNHKDVDYEALVKHRYLDACIAEALRKYCVSAISRVATEDTQLGDRAIEKGTVIDIQLYAMHHNEHYFPDPDRYNPDRFLVDDLVKPYTYLAFGAGPRNCIAQRVALLQIKVLIVRVVQTYRLVRVSRTTVPVVMKSNLEELHTEELFIGLEKI